MVFFERDQGPMLWFFKYFCKKISEKIGGFDSKQSYIMKKFDHNISFWEKRQFFAENWRKLQKIMIITSTPEMLLAVVFQQAGGSTYR
jgi:hypothetical protein